MEQENTSGLFSEPEDSYVALQAPFTVFDFRIDKSYLNGGKNPLKLPSNLTNEGEYFADVICDGLGAEKVYVTAYPTLNGIRLVGISEDSLKIHEISRGLVKMIASALKTNGYQIEECSEAYIW